MRDIVRFLTRALREGRPDIDVADARRCWAQFRIERGWGAPAPLLTPPSGNLKLGKDGAHPTWGLALAPADAGDANVCRFSTPECRRGCVAYAGNGLYKKVGQARQLKVAWLLAHPREFVTLLEHEMAQVDGYVRLNTFSDIPWERVAPWLVERGRLYDYSKWPDRVSTPEYNLTYSASERTTDDDIRARMDAMNVAVVFDTPRGAPLPEDYLGFPVIDGDKSDARWLDPRGVIVGLRAKGRMRTDINTLRMVRRAA